MSKVRWLLAVLAMAVAPASLAAQEPATIAGRVTSEAGAPVVNASVFIPELNLGTLTRTNGSFVLIVPAAEARAGRSVEVRAQLVGYRSQTQTVSLTPGATQTINFSLATDVLELEGVVATGVGQSARREQLGVSISSVRAEDITRAPTSNVVAAMAAKAPGVEITSSAGDPGSSAYIRIRGSKTIEGSGQPLFVVDGVPVTNAENFVPASVQYGEDSNLAGNISPNRVADINPNDIESIEILKGAAASAIYGARAANGVVLITTKRGSAGVTRATLSTTGSFDEVNRAIPLQRTYAQGNVGVSGGGLRSWGAPVNSPTYDHWDELFETGRLFDTNFSISGGTDRTQVYFSLGRVDHNGFIVGDNDSYEKTTARLRATHQLAEGLQVTGNFAYSATDGSFIQKGSNLSGLLLGGLRTPPNFDNGGLAGYRDEDGNQRTYSFAFDNPFFTIDQNRATSEVGRSFGNVAVDYTPAEWLRLNYTLGADYSNDNQLNILPLGNRTFEPGYLGSAQFLHRVLSHNATATGTRDLTEQIGGSATIGYSRESRRFDRYFVEGQTFIAPGVYTLDNTVDRVPNEYHERIHSESYFGQVQLDLADQLFLTGALRNDGFSTFGENERRHWFPKVSAAWEFTETAPALQSLLSFGKLRAAWGQAGNEPPAYGTVFGYTAGLVETGWGDKLQPTLGGIGGLYSGITKEQPDLRPERTTEWEVGMDLSFLQDRVGFNATYYDARTEDLILLAPLAPSTGFFEQLQNAAEVQNKGVELSLDVLAFEGRDVRVDLGANWATNDNEVVSLGEGVEFVTFDESFVGQAAVVGQPIGVFRGNDFYRCGNVGTDDPAAIQSACQGAPADAMYIGANGFPVLDPEVRVIGDPNPDWTGSLRGNVTVFNRIEVSALLDIKQGGEMWNGTRGALYSYGTHGDTEQRATCTAPVANSPAGCTGNELAFGTGILPGPVVGPGAGTAVPIGQNWYHLGNGSGFSPATAQFIEDASYKKLREIAVSYTVPQALAQRFGMEAVDLRVAGRNLYTWTDYTGIDPETNLTGTSEVRGQDYFNNPQARQWIFTVNLTR